MPVDQEGQKRVKDALEPELQMDVSTHVGARNRIQVSRRTVNVLNLSAISAAWLASVVLRIFILGDRSIIFFVVCLSGASRRANWFYF